MNKENYEKCVQWEKAEKERQRKIREHNALIRQKKRKEKQEQKQKQKQQQETPKMSWAETRLQAHQNMMRIWKESAAK